MILDGLIGQPVRLPVLLPGYMNYSIILKTSQKIVRLLIKLPQTITFHPVLSVYLADQQFGIQMRFNRLRPQGQGLFQRRRQGLIFRFIVGPLPQIFSVFRPYLSLGIADEPSGSGRPGVSLSRPIGEYHPRPGRLFLEIRQGLFLGGLGFSRIK
jgi:hypothetical protein